MLMETSKLGVGVISECGLRDSQTCSQCQKLSTPDLYINHMRGLKQKGLHPSYTQDKTFKNEDSKGV